MPAPTFTSVAAQQVMNRVTAKTMPFQWSINPYRGCAHGCSFCYARSTHTYFGLEADDSFQRQIFVKGNAAQALDKQLRQLAKKHDWNLEWMAASLGPVAIGTATDPYQPVEARQQVTRACLQVLARYRVPVTITTRSPLILRDLDILREMDVRSVNLSVNTVNRNIWRQMEPASPAPHRRLEAVAALTSAGLHAGIFFAPILPYITDSSREIDAVFDAARQAGAQFVMASVLRLEAAIQPWFFKTLAAYDEKLLPHYRRLYRNAYPPASYVEPLMRKIGARMERHGLSHPHDGRADQSQTDQHQTDQRTPSGGPGAQPATGQLLLPI